ncbi:MAG: tRNA (N(6)-L-threonylcarbamoyladenosine(37)-C(2))-methylthiotransferase MtaB [Waddliaceae bacterium]|nr:tRNA (N(6)-L-threonylcarbamoyladenosine(37)-C(2))-methylthiotransferase MtaB [Waddliaceae bacterium]
MQKKKKYKVLSLGCRTNQYEGQGFQAQLEGLGYEAVGENEQADFCIVNTCTVTASADSHSRHAIRRLARENPGAELLVTGCMVEGEGQKEKIAFIEGVSGVYSNLTKEDMLQKHFVDENVPEFSIKNFDAHTRAFVKIQDGCNSFCTYCVIPYVRGRSRSREMGPIVDEVHELVANGYKEIVLTGINIGDFDGGKKKGEKADSLADLIRVVDDVPGVERIRVSSIDPDEIDDELLDVILHGKHTCHSMHIVLQAGSNVVLKRMNRKYTRQMFLESVDRLYAASPDFTVTTDIIVGFPGETEQDFQETLEVMREVNFAKVHMFPYSDRPRTRANLYPNKVPVEIIKKRKQILLKEAEHASFSLREKFIGRKMWVLTETGDKERPGEIMGHTENFLPVWLPSQDYLSNELVEVELVENIPDGFIGKPVRAREEQAV